MSRWTKAFLYGFLIGVILKIFVMMGLGGYELLLDGPSGISAFIGEIVGQGLGLGILFLAIAWVKYKIIKK